MHLHGRCRRGDLEAKIKTHVTADRNADILLNECSKTCCAGRDRIIP